jgi:hypothetical protein
LAVDDSELREFLKESNGHEEIDHVPKPINCESCGEAVTPAMLTLGLVKRCVACGRRTCPQCRVATNQNEYLKPEVRGQPVCYDCWSSPFVMNRLQITCRSCNHPARNYSDIKTCLGWCNPRREICLSCGVPVEGGLVCRQCLPKYSSLKEELSSWPRM